MYRFLLVDDSRVMRRMLRNSLSANGYAGSEFHEAGDGQEALDCLDRLEFGVDVVFCDLCMPNLDGIQLIDRLAERGAIDDLPVIVLTGDVRESRGREALERGARKLLGKPFDPDGVKEALVDVLGDMQRSD